MFCRTSYFLCVAFIVGAIGGCASRQATNSRETGFVLGEVPQERIQIVPDAESRIQLDPNTVTEQSNLGPGSYCLIDSTTQGIHSLNGEQNDHALVAGRVVSIDDDKIVMDELICISRTATNTVAIPANQKRGHFTSRLFKNSGTGHKSMPVDGQIVVDRSTIKMIYPENGANWETLRNSGRWFMRPSLEFNYDLAKLEAAFQTNVRSDLKSASTNF